MKQTQIDDALCRRLIAAALEARKRSYAPYSHYHVGAALWTQSGKLYTGCNIENAAYTPTNCAERTAFFTAVAAGERQFLAIAIAGSPAEIDENGGRKIGKLTQAAWPCGVCMQTGDGRVFVIRIRFLSLLQKARAITKPHASKTAAGGLWLGESGGLYTIDCALIILISTEIESQRQEKRGTNFIEYAILSRRSWRSCCYVLKDSGISTERRNGTGNSCENPLEKPAGQNMQMES